MNTIAKTSDKEFIMSILAQGSFRIPEVGQTMTHDNKRYVIEKVEAVENRPLDYKITVK